jgi:hypothetical protein
MELYIFDRNLNFKGILEGYTSLRWTRRYYKSGEFELHCALTPEALSLLQRENIIYKKGDTEAGFIEYRNLKQDQEGKEILVIKGKFLTGYLNRRIIWGTEILNTTSEVAMRTLVNKNCITPIDSNRIIDNLMLGTLSSFIGNVDYQVSYKNLAEELENLSNLSNLGHRINLDITNKKLIFDVYKGLDRSVNQSVNPRAIFSKEFENILEQEFTDSLNNYRNLALVGGVGEGTARKLAIVGNSIGLDRFEVFVDQKSLSNEVDSVAMNDIDYNNLLIEKGNSTLAETKEIQTFDNKINLNSNLKYKADFDLGDIVTCVSKKWNLVLNTRITEVEEVYEEQGLSINITFGNNIPTLIDKIKSMSKQQSGAGGVSSTTSVEITSIDGGSFV